MNVACEARTEVVREACQQRDPLAFTAYRIKPRLRSWEANRHLSARLCKCPERAHRRRRELPASLCSEPD